jgi:branched-chain amino acid transport system substrate-binding protein
MALLLAVGCSASGSGGSSGSSGSATVIKVGVMCSCSGDSAFTSFNVPVSQVVQDWAKSVDAAGGLQGRQVQVVVENDNLNPGTSITDVGTLASQHVAAIVDASSLDAAWSATAGKDKIPVIGVYSNSESFQTNPYFFPEGQTETSVNKSIFAVAKMASVTKMGVMYCAESPVCANLGPQMIALGKTVGIPVPYTSSISASAPNYTAQCLAAKQAGVTGLFVGDAAAIIVRVAADCAQQNYNPVFVGEGAGSGESENTSPGLRNKLWAEYPDLPFFAGTPAIQAFDQAVNKYSPGVLQNKAVFTENAYMGWISMELFQKGLAASGVAPGSVVSADTVFKGLNTLKGETLDGTAPALTFAPGQPHAVTCYFIGRVQNGSPTVLNGGKPSCTSAS